MAYGNVGSADVVGVTPTLEFGVAFTLEFDAGSTLKGGTSSSCSGVHLFRLGVWCSERTPVSEHRILQWFRFSIALTGTILFEHFQEIRGCHDCVVVFGDGWHASVCREQLVSPAARAVSRLWIAEVHFAVVEHGWADVPRINGVGLERVPDRGR